MEMTDRIKEILKNAKEASKELKEKIMEAELTLFRLEENYEKRKEELIQKISYMNGQLSILKALEEMLSQGEGKDSSQGGQE